jgi:23S rRNA (adenine2503-C2)-methyltransferase
VTELVNPIKKVNLLDFDRKGLTAFFVGLGEKPFRATQLMKWIYQEDVYDFNEMTNFSKTLRADLSRLCVIETP